MQMPEYQGLIEDWKVELITNRAYVYRFRPDEIPDVLQEIVPRLLNFKYDPDHEGGAAESTVLIAIVDNHLLNMKRSRLRYQGHLQRFGQERVTESYDEPKELALDVKSVIAGLTEPEQIVCRGLAKGWSRYRIAKEMGYSWHRVNRIILGLRARFQELGLDKWLQK